MQTLFIIFFALVGIQFIYLTVFLITLLKKRVPSNGTVQPVSIIVCAHDEEQNLKELIPLLLEQEHPLFEVIIVNDRSNDGTYDYLLEETKKHSQLKMVNISSKPEHVNAKKYAITLGVKAAKHEWIVLTDADCRPHTTQWLRSMSKLYNNDKEIILGYSPYMEHPGLLNLFIRFETLLTGIQYLVYACLKNPYMGVGRNLAYKKSLFLENKGFNDLIDVTGGDDDLFVNKHATGKNTTVCVGESTLVYSVPKMDIQSFFHQKVRHLSTGRRYRFGHQLLLGIFMLSLLFTWVVGVFLIIGFSGIIGVAIAFGARLILLSATIYQASNRFGQKFEWWATPLLDFLFVFYYLSTAPIALITKKLQWRN